jgi:hypothetical protein
MHPRSKLAVQIDDEEAYDSLCANAKHDAKNFDQHLGHAGDISSIGSGKPLASVIE